MFVKDTKYGCIVCLSSAKNASFCMGSWDWLTAKVLFGYCKTNCWRSSQISWFWRLCLGNLWLLRWRRFLLLLIVKGRLLFICEAEFTLPFDFGEFSIKFFLDPIVSIICSGSSCRRIGVSAYQWPYQLRFIDCYIESLIDSLLQALWRHIICLIIFKFINNEASNILSVLLIWGKRLFYYEVVYKLLACGGTILLFWKFLLFGRTVHCLAFKCRSALFIWHKSVGKFSVLW